MSLGEKDFFEWVFIVPNCIQDNMYNKITLNTQRTLHYNNQEYRTRTDFFVFLGVDITASHMVLISVSIQCMTRRFKIIR